MAVKLGQADLDQQQVQHHAQLPGLVVVRRQRVLADAEQVDLLPDTISLLSSLFSHLVTKQLSKMHRNTTIKAVTEVFILTLKLFGWCDIRITSRSLSAIYRSNWTGHHAP